ncbi:hypothetical protein A0H81_03823 [Grifola frondosa]|uniref:Uncharacterized protein n=1 Tax=Grifola frondosa TaxID=5627 RepID=A0A1C7MGV8_GRIFR|nr:hypothetical protein A0H81_03823 [Grifola frondosa]
MIASPETMTQSTSSPPQVSSKSETKFYEAVGSYAASVGTRAPSAPPAPPPPPAPAPSTQFAASAAPAVPVPPARPQSTGTNLAKTTENDVFDQLARLSQLRTQSPMVLPPAPPAPARTPSLVTPPIGYQSGMGMGASPVPLGQHLQAQQTGMLPTSQPSPVNGPRGPYAPVPANQSLLQPLVPTTTGFAGFVSTRTQNTVSPFQLSPAPSLVPQPSFAAPQTLLSQPTGFAAPQQPLMSQPTGFINPGPMLSQPTGMPNGNFGLSAGGYSSMSTLQPNGGFGQIQSNPTGFNPGFGHLPMNSGFSSPAPAPPVPSAPPVTNTSPANVFAQMKSGTFANDETSGPQYADKYDALRPNPSPLTIQPTGWGYQGTNGFQGGYGYQ